MAPHRPRPLCPSLPARQVPEDVKTKVEAKAKELKDAIPTDDVAKVRRRCLEPCSAVRHLCRAV